MTLAAVPDVTPEPLLGQLTLGDIKIKPDMKLEFRGSTIVKEILPLGTVIKFTAQAVIVDEGNRMQFEKVKGEVIGTSGIHRQVAEVEEAWGIEVQ